MKRNIFLTAAVFLLVLSLSGCYDSNEIDSLSNVVAVGAEHIGSKTRFTFAIADIGSFGSPGDDGSKSGIICCLSESDSIESAIEDINERISKKLSFSHMSIIISDKKYAKNGASDAIKFFADMPDVRPQTLIALSDIKPSEFFAKLTPSLEVNPEKYFLNVFQKSEGYIPVLRICDYTDALSAKKDILAPVINGKIENDSASEEDISVNGVSVIRNGKYMYDIDQTDVAGLLNSTQNVTVDYNGKKVIMYSVKKPVIHAVIKGTQTHVNIDMLVKCSNKKFSDTKYLSEKIESCLTETAKKGYDIFGYADIFKKSFVNQKDYENYDWKSQIKRSKYSVTVKIVR